MSVPEHIFLADVHLGAFPEEQEKKLQSDLIALIDYCEKQKISLHILGDLFDYWMEYPGRTPDLGRELLDRFEVYNRHTGKITYITGNHDNWTAGHFEQRGFHVQPDYLVLNTGEQRIFLHHGDGMSDSKMGLPRPFFHRLLRHKMFVGLYQKVLPEKAGLRLMKAFSNANKAKNKTNPEKLNKWASSFLSASPYHVIISGHDHIPRMETFPHGLYINTGAFYRHRSMVIKYTNNEFSLVSWEAGKKEFKTLHCSDTNHTTSSNEQEPRPD